MTNPKMVPAGHLSRLCRPKISKKPASRPWPCSDLRDLIDLPWSTCFPPPRSWPRRGWTTWFVLHKDMYALGEIFGNVTTSPWGADSTSIYAEDINFKTTNGLGGEMDARISMPVDWWGVSLCICPSYFFFFQKPGLNEVAWAEALGKDGVVWIKMIVGKF